MLARTWLTERSASSCACGPITSSAAMKIRYENAFSPNAAGMPRYSTASAAVAGPIARARLNVIELSATAVGTSCGSTSDGTSACWAGAENALTIPSAIASAITTAGGARPCQASTPSPPERTIATLWVTSSSCRQLKRSEAAPAHGASTRIGMNCEKLRTPSRSAECV